jgi:NAD+ kinase
MLDILSRIADAVEEAVMKMPDSKSRGECIGIGADGTSTSQIDKVAENVVLDFLQRNNIPLNVLSEEIGFVDNGGKETLVLDPVDGTSNAIAGVPLYTISMAVGMNSLSDIHTAYIRNLATGDVITAEKGKGAYKNGSRINVRKADMDDLFLMIYLGNSATPASFALAKRVKSSRSLGCASLEMVLVAEGEADGFSLQVEKYTRGIRVVDIAASALILREAGGEIYDFEGDVLDMDFNIGRRSSFVAFGDKRVYDFITKEKIEITDSPRYGICVNTNVPDAKGYTSRLIKALEGCDYVLDDGIAGEFGRKGCPVEDMEVDIMITIGGDGTILRAAMKNKAPLIGINAGGVGFLAEVDAASMEEGIRRLREGDYIVEERFKLSSWYEGEYLAEAVNEAVVHTDTIAKIRHFKIYVDDEPMMELRADGIMISTPTGSTCYAMSLGAPLLDPRVNALVVVPMAAYKFSSRPFVVPADAKITVETVMDSGCLLVVDGQKEYEIKGKTHIDFIRSTETVKFIKFNTDFYSKVRDKLVNAL